MRVLATFLVVCCTLAGCAARAEEDTGATDDALTTYGDLWSTLEGADLDRWLAIRSSLVSGFDRICGDTICSGDYSNLTTVKLTCSSTAKARKLKECTWLLGASIDRVDPRTGKLTSSPRVFECKIPVSGTAPAMLSALEAAGDDALNAPLPGTNASFYDGLVTCFDGVVGPPPPADDGSTFWAELGDWAWEQGAERGAAWAETRARLATRFDDACGDSFCEGEYADIAPLRFVCAVNRNTKRVSRCSWTFAAADTSVGARGAIETRSTTRRCLVEVGAPADALVAALSGEDPLHAALPGKTTSIYDELVGCL